MNVTRSDLNLLRALESLTAHLDPAKRAKHLAAKCQALGDRMEEDLPVEETTDERR